MLKCTFLQLLNGKYVLCNSYMVMLTQNFWFLLKLCWKFSNKVSELLQNKWFVFNKTLYFLPFAAPCTSNMRIFSIRFNICNLSVQEVNDFWTKCPYRRMDAECKNLFMFSPVFSEDIFILSMHRNSCLRWYQMNGISCARISCWMGPDGDAEGVKRVDVIALKPLVARYRCLAKKTVVFLNRRITTSTTTTTEIHSSISFPLFAKESVSPDTNSVPEWDK